MDAVQNRSNYSQNKRTEPFATAVQQNGPDFADQNKRNIYCSIQNHEWLGEIMGFGILHFPNGDLIVITLNTLCDCV
jgi:hypothetical protein